MRSSYERWVTDEEDRAKLTRARLAAHRSDCALSLAPMGGLNKTVKDSRPSGFFDGKQSREV